MWCKYEKGCYNKRNKLDYLFQPQSLFEAEIISDALLKVHDAMEIEI